jgi:hypothetical protein
MYEYGTLKTVEVILRREREKKKNEGDEPNGVQYMHIWKYHNESPCITMIY